MKRLKEIKVIKRIIFDYIFECFFNISDNYYIFWVKLKVMLIYYVKKF